MKPNGLQTQIISGIQQKHLNKIFILAGAGISVAAGIPDFRSPNGVYAILSKQFKIPDPEAIFDISWFQHDPSGFYAFCKMYYEKHPYTPTLAHRFMKVLDTRKQLDYVFTQNIDGLEDQAGISKEKLVKCHGDMSHTKCLECQAIGEIDRFKQCINTMDIHNAQIQCTSCQGLVKPDVVFFGEQLPDRFHALSGKINKSDLVIVMGTSLKVFPVAGMMYDVKKGTPVMVVNLEMPEMVNRVEQKDVVFVEGEIEESMRKIARDIGLKELLQ